MNVPLRALILTLFLALAACGPRIEPPHIVGTPPPIGPADLVTPPGLPELGKWMYDPDLSPSSWLGEIFLGKTLREPINVVIEDPLAKSTEDAKQRLTEACRRAGFEVRFGHSDGYHGYIAGVFYPQLPTEPKHAFSNAPLEVDNSHGRIFGPAVVSGRYWFTAAFSREDIAPFDDPMHQYGSFNRARDEFAGGMEQRAGYRLVDFVLLHNALLDDPQATTGDHDGVATWLRAEK